MQGEVSMRGKAAIAGLGITEMGKVFGRTATDFAVEAIALALEDSGLAKDDLDGLLINAGVFGMSPAPGSLWLNLQNYLGLKDLKLLNVMNSYGSTAGAMVQWAAMCCASGMTKAVACVFADNPLVPEQGTGAAFSSLDLPSGLASLNGANGLFGINPLYAMAARRHMELYGTTSEQLGAIAVAQRKWAMMNPRAQMRAPMTIEDHQASRMIADPLRLLDCCLVSNGGIAVIVTGADLARNLRQPPVFIHGWGQGHPGDRPDKEVRTGAAISGPAAMKMAGITHQDVDILELYDCYTYTVLVTMEDYGFCPKGEGGNFMADGKTEPGGSLPTNTGGGQLSGYYMWSMTPVSEAVIQARGQGGQRQVSRNNIIMVSGNGGILDHHTTLILSPLSAL